MFKSPAVSAFLSPSAMSFPIITSLELRKGEMVMMSKSLGPAVVLDMTGMVFEELEAELNEECPVILRTQADWMAFGA